MIRLFGWEVESGHVRGGGREVGERKGWDKGREGGMRKGKRNERDEREREE